MKPVYISATVQDSGKTCVSIGLMQALCDRDLQPGYIKPVGQHYVEYQGKNIDEDAVLVHQVFNMPEKPSWLSPIAIERGFTRKFIFNPDVASLESKILGCVGQLEQIHPMMIVEGTGHAGVGSCFGLSNARVSELIGAKVVIVTGGGIGRPIDEVALSLALYQKHNVEVIGVVLNKVLPDKYEKVKSTVAQGLKNIGTRLLGTIPFEPSLTYFNMGQLVEAFKYKIVCGEEFLLNRIKKVVVAAMEPKHASRFINRDTLVIAPFDRTDNIIASATALAEYGAGGLIITGGIEPESEIIPLLKEFKIPVLASEKDTFTVTSRMKGLKFKIRTYDSDKINCLHELVGKYVDIEYILSALDE